MRLGGETVSMNSEVRVNERLSETGRGDCQDELRSESG